MTPEELKNARATLKVPQTAFARFLRISERQYTRYESGVSSIPGASAVLINCLLRRRIPTLNPRGWYEK